MIMRIVDFVPSTHLNGIMHTTCKGIPKRMPVNLFIMSMKAMCFDTDSCCITLLFWTFVGLEEQSPSEDHSLNVNL